MTQIKATYVDHMGSDLSVVNAARVSFGKHHTAVTPGDTKLIKYLAKHKHLSPFGHAFASFHVKAPLFVARQLVKHSYLRWNEVSRRYVDNDPEFYSPTKWRGRSADKKQGSAGSLDLSLFDHNGEVRGAVNDGLRADWLLEENNEACLRLYQVKLKAGVCPEQARMVLPQNTMTEWFWSGSLDAFSSMCKLRCATDTQVETQNVAWDINWEMEELFPVSWAALMEDY